MTNEMIVADYTEEITLTLTDVCEICRIEVIQVQDLVDYDILIPHGAHLAQWTFDMAQLKRLRTAIRLQRDLELNYAGVALVLQLLTELEELRTTADVYQKHLLK